MSVVDIKSCAHCKSDKAGEVKNRETAPKIFKRLCKACYAAHYQKAYNAKARKAKEAADRKRINSKIITALKRGLW